VDLPGTTIIPDCWAAYVRLPDEGYTPHCEPHHRIRRPTHRGAHQHHRGDMETCQGCAQRLQPQDTLHLLPHGIHVRISVSRYLCSVIHSLHRHREKCSLGAPASRSKFPLSTSPRTVRLMPLLLLLTPRKSSALRRTTFFCLVNFPAVVEL
jgi:hypothetical protein